MMTRMTVDAGKAYPGAVLVAVADVVVAAAVAVAVGCARE